MLRAVQRNALAVLHNAFNNKKGDGKP